RQRGKDDHCPSLPDLHLQRPRCLPRRRRPGRHGDGPWGEVGTAGDDSLHGGPHTRQMRSSSLCPPKNSNGIRLCSLPVSYEEKLLTLHHKGVASSRQWAASLSPSSR